MKVQSVKKKKKRAEVNNPDNLSQFFFIRNSKKLETQFNLILRSLS